MRRQEEARLEAKKRELEANELRWKQEEEERKKRLEEEEIRRKNEEEQERKRLEKLKKKQVPF